MGRAGSGGSRTKDGRVAVDRDRLAQWFKSEQGRYYSPNDTLSSYYDDWGGAEAEAVRRIAHLLPLSELLVVPDGLPRARYNVYMTSRLGVMLLMAPAKPRKGWEWAAVSTDWVGDPEADCAFSDDDTYEDVLEVLASSATDLLPAYRALCTAAT